MHTHIWSDCAIGCMILTSEVIKGHFRSNKFLWQVPWNWNSWMHCIVIFICFDTLHRHFYVVFIPW